MLAIITSVEKHPVIRKAGVIDDKKVAGFGKKTRIDLIMSPCHIRELSFCKALFCCLIEPGCMSTAVLDKG